MKTTQKRETVGKIASDLMLKAPYSTDPIEIEKELHREYARSIFDCINTARRSFVADFFVVVITKKEPLMPNVYRNYFFARVSCPTPDYDQTVYHYHKDKEDLDFLWVIPSKDTCLHMKEHAAEVVPAEWELLGFVLKFADGTLYKLAKRLNNEMEDSSALVQ